MGTSAADVGLFSPDKALSAALRVRKRVFFSAFIAPTIPRADDSVNFEVMKFIFNYFVIFCSVLFDKILHYPPDLFLFTRSEILNFS